MRKKTFITGKRDNEYAKNTAPLRFLCLLRVVRFSPVWPGPDQGQLPVPAVGPDWQSQSDEADQAKSASDRTFAMSAFSPIASSLNLNVTFDQKHYTLLLQISLKPQSAQHLLCIIHVVGQGFHSPILQSVLKHVL